MAKGPWKIEVKSDGQIHKQPDPFVYINSCEFIFSFSHKLALKTSGDFPEHTHKPNS